MKPNLSLKKHKQLAFWYDMAAIIITRNAVFLNKIILRLRKLNALRISEFRVCVGQ